MTKKGTFVYRCRRCGTIYQYATFSHLPASAKAACLAGSARDQLGREHFLMRPHTCPDGQVGITDLIGGEFTDKSEKSSFTPTNKDPA